MIDNEIAILETLYNDICSVYRNVEINGVFDDFEEKLIYKNIKCGISYSKGSTQDLKDIQYIDYIATLFINPNIEIKSGDIIVSNDLNFRCGEGVYYPSHAEIPLIRRDVTCPK